MANGLEPDQHQSHVSLDLGPNCLLSYQTATKAAARKEIAKRSIITGAQVW